MVASFAAYNAGDLILAISNGAYRIFCFIGHRLHLVLLEHRTFQGSWLDDN
jgi:hypothetical protein